MSIGISGDYNLGNIYSEDKLNSTSSTDAEKLKTQIANIDTENATDEELMEVCKSFESYLIENVYKSMESTIDKEEESNGVSALDYLGDMLPQAYAESVTESGGLGIAQQLYEAMKRDYE